MWSRIRESLITIALLLPGLGLILGFMSIVLYFAISQSFGQFNFAGDDSWTMEHWAKILDDPALWASFQYSLRIATLSAILSVAVAYPIAMWIRKPFRGSASIGVSVKIPYLIPGLVAAFLYVNFVSFNGILNHIFLALGVTDEPFRMQNDDKAIGVVILQVWKQTPLALLLLAGAVRAISDDVIAAARDLGAGMWTRFTDIVLPLTLQALQAAMIIIFIGAAGDFAFQTIAGPRSPFSMAQLMFVTQSTYSDSNYAAVIGVILMVMALIGALGLAGLTQLAVNRRRYQ